ncbi:MAG: DUF2283 domain-containing protein [Anaerolineae bacterium]
MEKAMNPKISNAISQAVPLLLDFPAKRFWVDYDSQADVLYLSFQRPQKATDTEMTDEGMLLRYRDDQLVGITILDASTRA